MCGWNFPHTQHLLKSAGEKRVVVAWCNQTVAGLEYAVGLQRSKTKLLENAIEIIQLNSL